jgi:ATP synthase protein I
MAYNKPIPSDGSKRRDNGGLATLVQAEKMMQIALLLPSAAFVGWLIGAWLDKKLHATWIAAAGIIFGGISGLIYVIRLVLSEGTMKGGKKNKRGGEL